MINNKFLPIGSIVLLKEGKKRLMIYGRKMRDNASQLEYDYMGCLYPEGNLEPGKAFLFNGDQIERVYFLGLQDAEEDTYCRNTLMK